MHSLITVIMYQYIAQPKVITCDTQYLHWLKFTRKNSNLPSTYAKLERFQRFAEFPPHVHACIFGKTVERLKILLPSYIKILVSHARGYDDGGC